LVARRLAAGGEGDFQREIGKIDGHQIPNPFLDPFVFVANISFIPALFGSASASS
jgi:hypothetical protein